MHACWLHSSITTESKCYFELLSRNVFAEHIYTDVSNDGNKLFPEIVLRRPNMICGMHIACGINKKIQKQHYEAMKTFLPYKLHRGR